MPHLIKLARADSLKGVGFEEYKCKNSAKHLKAKRYE